MNKENNNKIIICGSKKYNHINFDSLVDSFDFIIRHNFLTNNVGYGKKYASLQVLNNHVYRNFVQNKYNLDKLNEDYTCFGFVESNFLSFKNYLSQCKESAHFIDNNKHLLKNLNLDSNITKQPRSGISSVLEVISRGYKPYLIGYSLCYEDFKKHATIKNVDTHEQSLSHNNNEEIDLLIEMHNKSLIDASLCTIVDKSGIISFDNIPAINITSEALDIVKRFENNT